MPFFRKKFDAETFTFIPPILRLIMYGVGTVATKRKQFDFLFFQLHGLSIPLD